MSSTNATTTVTEFILVGFPGLQPKYYKLLAAFLFFAYVALATGNIFIIIFVAFVRSLQKPTYILFCSLAICDLAFGTATLPKIIAKYWNADSRISFNACFIQMYLVHFLGSSCSFIMALMALDRFIAIYKPLHYPALIKNSTILLLCAVSCTFNSVQMAAIVNQAIALPYCRSNLITQCYCDHISITRLACTDTKSVDTAAVSIAMFVLWGPLSFIVFSYVSIIITVIKTCSTEGGYKAFSTCMPQLVIICLYYIPRSFAYLTHFAGYDFDIDIRILITVCYSLFPAIINPIIYCFRTKEIKDTLMKKLRSRTARIDLQTIFR